MSGNVASFAEIEQEFMARVSRIVWCTVSTVDRKGRPRSRILHPIWEGSTGWIATGRHTLKTKHLARNPYVSLSYWDQQHQQVYADCRAEWDDSMEQKRRIWDLYKNTPPPLGYDPGMIWKGGPEDPTFGLLKLIPWRVELFSLQDMITAAPKVWQPG
jgi:general stress protein 26